MPNDYRSLNNISHLITLPQKHPKSMNDEWRLKARAIIGMYPSQGPFCLVGNNINSKGSPRVRKRWYGFGGMCIRAIKSSVTSPKCPAALLKLSGFWLLPKFDSRCWIYGLLYWWSSLVFSLKLGWDLLDTRTVLKSLSNHWIDEVIRVNCNVIVK